MIKYVATLCGVVAGMSLAFASGPQEQTIYKWTDIDGVVHYDSAPPAAKTGAIKLRVPLARPAAPASSGSNIDSELQHALAARIERERAQRQEADKRAAQLTLRAEQDAALQAECERAGRSYCDDLEKIHANEIRHAEERQRLRQRAVRDAANLSKD